jgi:hypothetical protein
MDARCINALAETVASKQAFRDAFARGQRCVVRNRRVFRAVIAAADRPALSTSSPSPSHRIRDNAA